MLIVCLVVAIVLLFMIGFVGATNEKTERWVLEQLASGDRYGSELIEASGGRLRRGSAYVVLARMEDRGLIVGEIQPGFSPGPQRRRYAITDRGRAYTKVAS